MARVPRPRGETPRFLGRRMRWDGRVGYGAWRCTVGPICATMLPYGDTEHNANAPWVGWAKFGEFAIDDHHQQDPHGYHYSATDCADDLSATVLTYLRTFSDLSEALPASVTRKGLAVAS